MANKSALSSDNSFTIKALYPPSRLLEATEDNPCDAANLTAASL